MADREYVKCPKCGTITWTDHPRYPACQKCHEFLRKHRYCVHYEPITKECTHPEVVFEVERKDPDARATLPDADEPHQCAYFEPIALLEAPTGWRRVAAGPVGRVILLSLLLSSGIVFYFVRSMRQFERTARQTRMEYELFCPDETYLDQPFLMQCIIRNLDEKEAETVEVRFNERLFGWFEMLDISPPPSRLRVQGAGRYLYYDHLAGESELLIRIRMKGTQVGTYELAVQVRSPGQYQSEVDHYPIDVL